MPREDYGLGRIHAPDERDAMYPMRAALPVEPPPARKMWRFRGDVLDQSATGTCVAHAWMHFLRCAPLQTKKVGYTAYELYRKLVLLDEFPANDAEANGPDTGLQYGSSVRAGAKALEADGRLVQYVWAHNLQTAVEFVLTKGPVVLGTNWYESMFNVDREKYARITPTSTVAGGHAYLLRGVDRPRGRGRIVNSWSERWADGGEAWVDFKDLERLIHENGEACAATEKRKLIEPESAPVQALLA